MKPLSDPELKRQLAVARDQDFVKFATEISYEDENAVMLIGDKSCPIITSVAHSDSNENIYPDTVAYLQHRLKVNHNSLDKLVKELEYRKPADFLAVLCDQTTTTSLKDLIKDVYQQPSIIDPTKFLITRLQKNHNSLDHLCQELDFYDTASFLEFFTDERPDDDTFNDLVYNVYGGEYLVDNYQ